MSILKIILRRFNLQQDAEDKLITLEAVSKNASFRGSGLWILACAILIASVGLNVNSTAVIIGAMLISPLMGPITGAGFALGIYDFDLLKKSIRNLGVATFVSMAVSTLYFFVSPFKDAHSEILSRTYPTIFDVIIAFSGGVVGAIAITRMEKGNPIPGVAIATALMPPLCTAGFGLANGQWRFFWGAFYLYTINCVFICIATFFMVKYLGFPLKTLINADQQKKIRIAITIIIIIMVLPSAYLAYSLLQKQKFKKQVDEFVEKEFTKAGLTIVYRKENAETSPRKLDLAFLSKVFTSAELDSLTQKLPEYGLYNTRLIIHQDSSDYRNNSLQNEEYLEELYYQNKEALENKEAKLALLEAKVKEFSLLHFDGQKLLKESSVLFPQIESFSVSKHLISTKIKSGYKIDTFLVATIGSRKKISLKDKEKLTQWLKQRLEYNKLKLVQVSEK